MGSYRDAQPTEETAAAGGLKRCTWSHRHARGFEDEDEHGQVNVSDDITALRASSDDAPFFEAEIRGSARGRGTDHDVIHELEV